MNQDTICAIATAQGGAIGSIRVSGPEAISITSRIFKPAKAGKLFNDQKPYTLTFGRIYDGEEIIDMFCLSSSHAAIKQRALPACRHKPALQRPDQTGCW